MASSSPVLVAEANTHEISLIRRAFHEVEAANPILVVHSGAEAIDYLAGEGQFASRDKFPFPCLFLLDLKVPGKNGLEVLQWLGDHPDIPRRLPVVVISSTDMQEATQQAYAMDIQACIVEPPSYEDLRDRIRILKEYWLDYEAQN